MNPDYASNVPDYDPKQRVGNALSVMQPGETTVCDIKRHPIGIMIIYIMSGFLLLVVAVLAFAVAPHFNDSFGGSNHATQIGAIVLLILATICAVYSLIATRIYWGNQWVVTTDSLTQINQTSLFDRQSSQLSLGNLEDVTAEQNGILPHMFNYGLLRVETAGERSKFMFFYCPNPNFYAQKILEARENFEQRRRSGEDSQQLYRQQGAYPLPEQQQPPQPPMPVPPYQPGPPPPDPGVNINTE